MKIIDNFLPEYQFKQLQSIILGDEFSWYWNDTIVFPDIYKTVLLARARYYVHQFKENPQAAAFALEDYRRGLRLMKLHLMESTPGYFKDDRIRFA